jgi:ribosomal-protein-alanine N-acetyltransferase
MSSHEPGRLSQADVSGVPPIRAGRLTLVPATLALLDADLESGEALGRGLNAVVPESWPPGEYDRGAAEFFRDRLAEEPGSAGWYGWYAIWRPEDRLPILIGMVGYLGPPDPSGTVEIGYSIATEFRAGGFATEIVRALVARAWASPGVRRVIARVRSGNAGSEKVLQRCGFARVGPAEEAGVEEYEAPRPPA